MAGESTPDTPNPKEILWIDTTNPYTGVVTEYAESAESDVPPLTPYQSFLDPNDWVPGYTGDECGDALKFLDYVRRITGRDLQKLRDKNVDCLKLRAWIDVLESGGGGPVDDQTLVSLLVDEWTSAKDDNYRTYMMRLLRLFQSAGGQGGGGALAVAKERLKRCEREYDKLLESYEFDLDAAEQAVEEVEEECP